MTGKYFWQWLPSYLDYAVLVWYPHYNFHIAELEVEYDVLYRGDFFKHLLYVDNNLTYFTTY